MALTLIQGSCHHIETSQLICRANQLTGFYMMATLAFNELILLQSFAWINNPDATGSLLSL